MARGGKRVNKTEMRKRVWERDSRKAASKLMPSITTSSQALDAGKFWEVRDLTERYDDDLDEIVLNEIVDRSLTSKTFLRLQQSVPVRGVKLANSQLDVKTGEMIDGSDIRITKMSERTLLRRGIPDKVPTLVRETSRSKRKRLDPDAPIAREPRFPATSIIPMEEIEAIAASLPTGRLFVPAKGVKL